MTNAVLGHFDLIITKDPWPGNVVLRESQMTDY